MSRRTVLFDAALEGVARGVTEKSGIIEKAAYVLANLGLDPDTPFDPPRQRCVVVDVCTTCEGSGHGDCERPECDLSCPVRCPVCEGRGWVIP